MIMTPSPSFDLSYQTQVQQVCSTFCKCFIDFIKAFWLKKAASRYASHVSLIVDTAFILSPSSLKMCIFPIFMNISKWSILKEKHTLIKSILNTMSLNPCTLVFLIFAVQIYLPLSIPIQVFKSASAWGLLSAVLFINDCAQLDNIFHRCHWCFYGNKWHSFISHGYKNHSR